MNKGISNNLMKSSASRRRTKQEIKEQKLQEELQRREIDEERQQFAEMKEQLNQLRRQSKAHGIPQEVQQQIEFAKHAKEAVD